MQFRRIYMLRVVISCVFIVASFPCIAILQSSNALASSSSTSGQTFTSNSVLSSGQWTKISVPSTGVYQITFAQLKQMGVTNPQNVHIYGYGGAMLPENFANTYLDDLPENAIYIGSNYILFYAQGPVSWQYNSSNKAFVHTVNPYSNYGYYFVTQTSTAAKQISAAAVVTSTPTSTVNYFLDYGVHENDWVNVATSGRTFYGEKFTEGTTMPFSFSFSNTDLTRSGKVSVDAIGNANISNWFNTQVGGISEGTFYIPAVGTYDYALEGTGLYSFAPTGDNTTVSLTYNSGGSAIGYLHYIEMNVYRKLMMTNTAMAFRNPDFASQGQVLQYSLAGAGSNVQVWNVTDPQNIQAMSVTHQNDSLTFVSSAQTLQEYLAIDPTQSSSFGSPTIVQTNLPDQNLHALSQQDMVIISPSAFVSQAERLAQAHRDKDNLNVVVVTPDQVYNEFSSGTPDVTAYRRLMKMFYNRAVAGAGTAPKYLLLFGRGCYDNKGILSITPASYRQLLSYESVNSLSEVDSYMSDDYFGFLSDNSGVNLSSDSLKIGVGRFPVTSLADATTAVDKAITYMNNTNTGYWKNQVCFVADQGNNNLFSSQADTIAKWTTTANPDVRVNKLYLDAYQQVTSSKGFSYPVAKTQLLNLIKSGLLMLNYTGHGSYINWSAANLLSAEDITSMYNTDLPLWVTATCDFTRCDYTAITAGENVFLNANGGGIALFTTTRVVFANDNALINQQFAKNVFYKDASGNALRLGDVMRLTKNALPGNDNKMNFIFVGDPAMKLAFPAPNYTVVADSINNTPVSQLDTLKSLDVFTLKGQVNLPNSNSVCSDFNGYVQVVVFDKVETLTTLVSSTSAGNFTYQDRPNVLFSGKAQVTNGRFSIQSVIPKDIDYSYGTGRMNFYAADTQGREGQGNFTSFIVGGSNDSVKWLSSAPTINMYLNAPSFKSGDKVNETPLFVANVSDSTGINTVGNGIGHDMTVTIDQDPTQYYVVNDYFQPTENDYRSGIVSYSLPTMSNGQHSLTFKVWNVLNISNSKTFNFVVQKGLSPDLYSISNYPNPVVNGTTNFVLVHDRPDAVLYLKVYVYDLSGRLLTTLSSTVATDSNTTVIPWNVTDSSGNPLKSGLYLYRMGVSTQDGEMTSKTQKVIVSRQ